MKEEIKQEIKEAQKTKELYLQDLEITKEDWNDIKNSEIYYTINRLEIDYCNFLSDVIFDFPNLEVLEIRSSDILSTRKIDISKLDKIGSMTIYFEPHHICEQIVNQLVNLKNPQLINDLRFTFLGKFDRFDLLPNLTSIYIYFCPVIPLSLKNLNLRWVSINESPQYIDSNSDFRYCNFDFDLKTIIILCKKLGIKYEKIEKYSWLNVISFKDFELYNILKADKTAPFFSEIITPNTNQEIENFYYTTKKQFSKIKKGVIYDNKDILESYNKVFQSNNGFNTIKINNYKIINDLQLSELSQKINIVVGINGRGKTTLLQAITLNFLQKYNIDYSPKEIANKHKKENVTVFFANYKICKSEELNNFMCLAYGENFFSKNDSHEHLNEFIEDFYYGLEIPIFARTIFNSYDDKLIDIIKFLNITTEGELPSRLLHIYEKLNELRQFLIKSINNFINAVLQDEYEIVKDGGYRIKDSHKNLYKLDEISEGYRANIVLIADIFMRIIASRHCFAFDKLDDLFNQVRGIICIDEFDRHLHPTAQRRFLQQLITTFPKVQFFLTTHNIFALQSAAGHKAYILKSDTNNKIFAESHDVKYGRSLETLNNIFYEGQNQIYDIETEKFW